MKTMFDLTQFEDNSDSMTCTVSVTCEGQKHWHWQDVLLAVQFLPCVYHGG